MNNFYGIGICDLIDTEKKNPLPKDFEKLSKKKLRREYLTLRSSYIHLRCHTDRNQSDPLTQKTEIGQSPFKIKSLIQPVPKTTMSHTINKWLEYWKNNTLKI